MRRPEGIVDRKEGPVLALPRMLQTVCQRPFVAGAEQCYICGQARFWTEAVLEPLQGPFDRDTVGGTTKIKSHLGF